MNAIPEPLREQLRRSYRCGCVEPWDKRPGRVTLAVLTGDPGEQSLDHMHEATGTRQHACPWQALRDPFVRSVLAAHRHWIKGELASRMGRVPEALMQGLEIFDAALNAVQVTDLRAEREEREERAEEARRAMESRGRGSY